VSTRGRGRGAKRGNRLPNARGTTWKRHTFGTPPAETGTRCGARVLLRSDARTESFNSITPQLSLHRGSLLLSTFEFRSVSDEYRIPVSRKQSGYARAMCTCVLAAGAAQRLLNTGCRGLHSKKGNGTRNTMIPGSMVRGAKRIKELQRFQGFG
jgi:hypothetical protein